MKNHSCCKTTIVVICTFVFLAIFQGISFAQGTAEQEAKLNARIKAAEDAANKLPSNEKKLDWRLFKFIKEKEREKLSGQTKDSISINKSRSKSMCLDNQNRVQVNVVLLSGKEKELASVEGLITSVGGSIRLKTKETSNTPIEIYCWIPYDQIAEVAKHPAIGFIELITGPTVRVGQVTSAGDVQLKANLAREYFNAGGSGIKVGVISNGVKYYSNSVSSGDLPSTFGPSNIVNGGDPNGSEGTAMLEIVHDIAPDATLYFGGVNVSEGPNDMAGRITDLKDAGCNIIVDDLGWIVQEPHFTADNLYNTILDFANHGSYISAAGNDAQSAWDGTYFGDVDKWLLFWHQDGYPYSNFNEIDNLAPGQSVTIVLQWSNRWDYARQDYDLYLLDWSMQVIDSSCAVQGTQGSKPREVINYTRPTSGMPIPPFYIRVKKKDQTNVENEIRLIISQDVILKYTYPNYVQGETKPRRQIYGHTMAGISVAANWPENQNNLEPFSSRGPSKNYNFSSDGLTWTVQSINTPTITATNGVVTKVGKDGHFGSDSLFFGTSASAPHVAGIAALFYSKYPTLSFQTILTQSADTMSNYGAGGIYNDQCGYGRANALEALIAPLPVISPGTVTSNTSWQDVQVVAGSTTINAGVTVTVPTGKICVLKSSIVFGDNTAKIVVSGTLFVRSGMNVNQDQVIAQMPYGVVIYEGMPMKQVTISQVDQLDQPFDSMGVWKSNRFENNAVPFYPTWMIGASKILRAKQDFKVGTTQKFRKWKNRDDVQNHQTFSINQDVEEIVSQFSSSSNATVQAQLIDGGNPGGTVDFKDPWLIDTTDNYGSRNRGMSALFKSVPYSLYNVGTTSNYKGVFLNQYPPTDTSHPPYYTVRAPQTQTITVNGLSFPGSFFQGWTKSGATLADSTNDTTAVVFNSANSTLTALYKAHLGSSVSTATAGNGGRKIIRRPLGTYNELYYAVYSSAGFIWFTRTNAGADVTDPADWTPEIKLGEGKNPSIAITSSGELRVVWEKEPVSGQRVVYYSRSTNDGTSWDAPITIATTTQTYDATPVPLTTEYMRALWRGADGLYASIYITYGTPQWIQSGLSLLSSIAQCPSVCTIATSSDTSFGLVCQDANKIMYCKIIYATLYVGVTDIKELSAPGTTGNINPTIALGLYGGWWGDGVVAWENINTHKVYARSTTDKGSTWSGIYEFSHGTDYLSKPTVGYNYGCLLLCQCQAPGGEVRIVESYEFSPSMADIGAGTAPSLLEYGVSYYPLALSTKGAAVPYAINPIVLPEVQYISGNITENTEWSGIVNVLGTVTVNAGVTLTITPGTTIFFNGGSSLYVNGTLNAAGNSSQRITFDRNGVSGTWGGIRFNSGSSGTVSYCDIKHAVYGIYCTGASPTISNNTITNCSADGIYLYNAAPSIKWNTISNNMGSGVYSHGSPSYVYLYRNTITGNQGAGINAYDSDLWLSQPGGSGYNAIRQNNQGITAAYNSCVYLVGMGGPNSAYNCVHNNTGLEVTAAYNSTVQAPKTFWNRPSPYTPWPSDYSLYYSTFTYSNPLSSDPNPGCPSLPQNLMVAGTSSELTDSPMQKTSVESSSTAASEEDDLLPVVQLEIEGKYTEAIAQATLLWTNELQQAASTSQKEIVKRQARKWRILTCLASCYRAAGRKDFVDFLNKEIRPKLSIYDELYAATLELEGRSLVNEGKYKKAIENWDILKIRFAKKASVHSYALYNLAYTYYDVLGDKAKAGEYFEELKAKYPDDEMTWHCRVLFGETDSLNYHKGAALQKEAFAEAYLPEEFGISQNYPNPFNPATTICYQLPGAGTRYIVSLKVYDLLGREVARLVDGVKEAGYYTATFDGSRLASGIYFTRFVVQPENETRPFVQVKKMLLMK